ncbi:MAG TPA: GtrA family protein [Pseudolabrys sp.]|nr:GtrA family protein [Pseudolabrys sp.]
MTLRQIASLYLSGQFGRFLIAGGVALLLNWLCRFVFNWFVDFGWAVVLAYAVGIAVAFVLNKIFVFPYSERSLNFELFLFFLVNIAAFPYVWSIAYVLGEWVLVHWMPKQVAFAFGHAIAIATPVFVNFFLHKFVTFRGA